MNDICLRVGKRYLDKVVFARLDLEIRFGEILCVLGPSGVGKTTLLRMLAGLTDYDGEIFNLPENVGYIFQEPRLIPHLTVAGNLAYVGVETGKIDGILEKCGLLSCKNQKASTLSGGEKQRVAFARAFANRANLLLLDEPFSSLDIALKMKLYQSFATLWSEDRPTSVLVTHDIEEALALAHRVVVLKDGKIVCDLRLERKELPSAYGAFAREREILLQSLIKE